MFTETERQAVHRAIDAMIAGARRRLGPKSNGSRLIVPPQVSIASLVKPGEVEEFVRDFFGERAP